MKIEITREMRQTWGREGGLIGGKAKGRRKRRPIAVYRAGALKRWARVRAARLAEEVVQ